jgi:hypothetical protein
VKRFDAQRATLLQLARRRLHEIISRWTGDTTPLRYEYEYRRNSTGNLLTTIEPQVPTGGELAGVVGQTWSGLP